jgi:hypothetical protein
MKLAAWLCMASGAMVMAHASCGFPDVEYETEDTSAGGNASSSVTGGGTTSMGGAGGPTSSTGGAAPCSLYEQTNSCASDMKCTVLDPQTGEIGCGLFGTKKRWETCNTDRDCDRGLWCDLRFKVCKPWCQNLSDCVFGSFNGECVVADNGNLADIPGSPTHCIPNCDPKSASPCATTDSVTCVHLGSNAFDCVESRNFNPGADCVSSSDCAPGLACTAPPMTQSTCTLWCSPPELFSPDCGLGQCSGLQPTITWQGSEMGTCG